MNAGHPASEAKTEAANHEHGYRDRHPQRDQQQADAEHQGAELDAGHRAGILKCRNSSRAQITASTPPPSRAEK